MENEKAPPKVSAGKVKWLLGEIPGWVEEGLIGREAGDKIAERYRLAQAASGRTKLVYAVGILGHEMLTAQPAYRGAGLERIVAQRTADPPEPPQFIAGHPLYEIIRKLTRRDPAERYQSAEVALRDVDALKQSKGKLWM